MKQKFSGKEVIKAGEALQSDDLINNEHEFDKAFEILSYWRFSHEASLEQAFRLLQEVVLAKDKQAIFAKRLKRYLSIVKKLRRFKDMKLKNMQDIGGCRAIVSSLKKARQVSRELKKRDEFKNSTGKVRFKDYVQHPKDDGYRGYHIIGQFNNEYGEKRNIEVQIRTRLQHDWATTVEIVDLFTGQALKSNQGEDYWKEFFGNVSKQFALMESIHLFDTMKIEDKFKDYYEKLLSGDKDKNMKSCIYAKDYAKRLDVVTKLQAYSNSLLILDKRLENEKVDGYALLEVDTEKKSVTSKLFQKDDAEEAERMYAESEKKAASQKNLVVALVSTNSLGSIKAAYPNYFADSTEFIAHLMMIIKIPTSPFEKFLFE